MNVICGLWSFDGNSLDFERLESVASYASERGYDSHRTRDVGKVRMICHSSNSFIGDSSDGQPHSSAAGTTMMWDGRLDNRTTLEARLRESPTPSMHIGSASFDLVVLHAFCDQEGTDGLVSIVGDWTLSIWDEQRRRLVLGCDFSGTRHLYYRKLPRGILWCNDLRGLVMGSGCTFELSDSYVGHYLEGMPDANETPYSGIHVVPPGCFVSVTEDAISIIRYWNWNPITPIRYKSDGDYEHHLYSELQQAVARRIRSDCPVVAELSGGVDSSSIVCLADRTREADPSIVPALHTLSYYDDDEPSCDERPYFSIIESSRNSIGTHINARKYNKVDLTLPGFLSLPVYPQSIVEAESDRWDVMRQKGAKILLSGFGGDEFLGGVPTGIPELADLAKSFDLVGFVQSIARWGSPRGSSYWRLLIDSTRAAFSSGIDDSRHFMSDHFMDDTTSLLATEFRRGLREGRKNVLNDRADSAASPSQRMFVEAWAGVARQLAYRQPPMFGCYDTVYPCLDRDLLSYIFNIPRSQVIRARERRSLMRRSLDSVVPREVLWRKNKATITRRYMRSLAALASDLEQLMSVRESLSVQFGYVDPSKFVASLRRACNGDPHYHLGVMRAVGLECWLRGASRYVRRGAVPERAAGDKYLSHKIHIPLAVDSGQRVN